VTDSQQGNPFRMGVSDNHETPVHTNEHPQSSVSIYQAAGKSLAGTLLAGSVFGMGILLSAYGGATVGFFGLGGSLLFGAIVGLFFAACGAIPSHLAVFAIAGMIHGSRLSRKHAIISAVVSGGMAGLTSVAWITGRSGGVPFLWVIIASVLGGGFAGAAVSSMTTEGGNADLLQSRWEDLDGESVDGTSE